MTDFEKHIYNTHLRVSRTAQGKPFRFRKDFGDIENTPVEVVLQKLSSFFAKFKHVKMELFFEAPYKIHSDSTPYYLDYYLSPKAIKTYSIYISKLKNEDPDTSSQLRYVIDSFKFIKEFCEHNKIPFNQYCNYNTGATFNFITHLREFNVSVYAMFAFEDFEKKLWTIDIDTLKFILGDDYVERFYVFRNKYLDSKKCKMLSTLAYNKLTKN